MFTRGEVNRLAREIRKTPFNAGEEQFEEPNSVARGILTRTRWQRLHGHAPITLVVHIETNGVNY